MKITRGRESLTITQYSIQRKLPDEARLDDDDVLDGKDQAAWQATKDFVSKCATIHFGKRL